MRRLLLAATVSTLSALAGCGDESETPPRPKAITTELSDISTYGLLADTTTCDDFVAMSEDERLQTLRYVDMVKDIDKPGRTLATLAGYVADLCALDDGDLGDVGIDTVLVNYQ